MLLCTVWAINFLIEFLGLIVNCLYTALSISLVVCKLPAKFQKSKLMAAILLLHNQEIFYQLPIFEPLVFLNKTGDFFFFTTTCTCVQEMGPLPIPNFNAVARMFHFIAICKDCISHFSHSVQVQVNWLAFCLKLNVKDDLFHGCLHPQCCGVNLIFL